MADRRLDMRQMDIECEAWMYQERAHQDFGLDKRSTEMIRFQQLLAFNCKEFIEFLGRTDPKGRQQWKKLNPDIPALLAKFETYRAELLAQGTVDKSNTYAESRVKKQDAITFEKGPAKKIMQVGDRLQFGLGSSPDAKQATVWYRRAAQMGCAEAQLRLAKMYLDGSGPGQNLRQAYYTIER